jgi:hypothetical protein
MSASKVRTGLFCVALALGATGCGTDGGDEHGAGGGGAAGIGGSGGTGGGDRGGNGGVGGATACNDVRYTSAPSIPVTRADENPPIEPEGGVILDGTYFRTSAVIYTGPGGETATWSDPKRSALRVFAGTFEFPAEEGDEESIPANYEYTTDGTTLTLVSSCPAEFAGFEITAGYSATSNELIIFDERTASYADGIVSHETWTLQR